MRNQAETYVITDLQQIKALADPLRQQILGAFVSEPRTTKQVATILGQPATKLYHHVDLLRRVGLIDLVATKPKRGTTEKYFQAIAHRFSVAGTSLSGEAASVLEESFSQALACVQSEIRKAAADVESGKESRTIIALGALRIAPEDLPELQARILGIAKELSSEPTDPKRESYQYLVAVYPAPNAFEEN